MRRRCRRSASVRSITCSARAASSCSRRRSSPRSTGASFPQSLDGAPLLLPTENTALRRSLDQWFASRDLRPKVVGEFEDSALLQVFGQAGVGIFPAHSFIADEVRRQSQVLSIGRLQGVRERFYAISVERKLKHPAALAISEAARKRER